MTNKKVLYFEGAGWEGADVSQNTDVTNCRIRTRIRNKEGRLIYLELGCCEVTKNSPKRYQGLKYATHFDSIFYDDASWDKRRNYSQNLSHLEKETFEYNKANILKFINDKLNCDFETMEVINDNSIGVHRTEEPLSDCSIEGYKPFEEIEVNINQLEDMMPMANYEKHCLKQYKIDSKSILHLIPGVLSHYTNDEIEKHSKSSCIVSIRYNEKGIIWSCELSCGFGCIGMGIEDLEEIINIIKNYKEA